MSADLIEEVQGKLEVSSVLLVVVRERKRIRVTVKGGKLGVVLFD